LNALCSAWRIARLAPWDSHAAGAYRAALKPVIVKGRFNSPSAGNSIGWVLLRKSETEASNNVGTAWTAVENQSLRDQMDSVEQAKKKMAETESTFARLFAADALLQKPALMKIFVARDGTTDSEKEAAASWTKDELLTRLKKLRGKDLAKMQDEYREDSKATAEAWELTAHRLKTGRPPADVQRHWDVVRANPELEPVGKFFGGVRTVLATMRDLANRREAMARGVLLATEKQLEDADTRQPAYGAMLSHIYSHMACYFL
jgi:hypothetical protein